MKKIIISLGFAALALGATAQVKIKDGTVTSSTVPNSNAILELESNNKGLLYPRVSLTSLTAPLTGGAMVAGMVVYDTATVAASGITPGLYYNNGTQWVRVANNSANTNTAFIYGAGTPAAAGATCNGTAQNTIYVDTGSTSATQGQTWICDGTNWQAYNAPASTEWYLAGSNTADAGGNKIANIARAGSVVIGSTGTPAKVATDTSGSTVAQRLAVLTVAGGDAWIDSITVGRGGGQIRSNTAVGQSSLQANTTGNSNVAVGYQTLQNNTTGQQNTAVGLLALDLNTTGNNSTAIGYRALQNNTTGISNGAIGYRALWNNTTGSSNNTIGFNSLYSNTRGNYNVAMGDLAFYSDSTGNYNIALGYQAGYTQTSGNRNIAIGYVTNLPNTAGNYQLNIGNAIWGTGVDSIVSNASNIGINTSTPTSSFYVNGSQGGKIISQTNSYTLSATDYTVVFTGGTTATLPPATNITGRIYRIVNKTGAAMTINANGGSTVSLLSGTTLAAATAATFQASGTTWYQIQ